MASWKWPNVLNKMLEDIPGINVLLNALLKQDVAGTTDVPAGAKQWVDTPEGKQFQVFNGQSWSSVGKLAHDAASVDGYSTSTGTTANTIPVRDSSGKIPGDITGNAATASKAAALSATNPIATGGTGATTAEQARANLGTPPKSHAASSTEYGAGTSALYGHLKSHDEPDSTLTAASGHALSPAGAAAMQETLEGQIGDLAGVVSGNAAAQNAKDAAQDAAISAAQSSADAAQSSADAAQSSADAAVNSVPTGTLIAFAANSEPPGGYLLCNGAAVSRTTYAELFEAIGVTYGKGDGSTTFNIPDLDGRVLQGTNGRALYVPAGLPEIYGNAGDILWNTHIGLSEEGALYYTGLGSGAWAYIGDGDYWSGTAKLHVAASRYNSIYGKSDTVQPRALALRYYIKY